MLVFRSAESERTSSTLVCTFPDEPNVLCLPIGLLHALEEAFLQATPQRFLDTKASVPSAVGPKGRG